MACQETATVAAVILKIRKSIMLYRRAMTSLLFCTVILATSFLPHAGKALEIDDDLICESVQTAKHLVDKAYSDTKTSLENNLKREDVSPTDIMAFFKQSVAGNSEAIRSADYMNVALQVLSDRLKRICQEPFNVSDVLTEKQKETIGQMTGCAQQSLYKNCNNSPYRSISGKCNNRNKPDLGASNTGQKHLLPPEYEDGCCLPRGWTKSRDINGNPLPSAYDISNNFNRKSDGLTLAINKMQFHFGQFIDHDLGLSPDTPSTFTFFKGADCGTSCARAEPCFPIEIPNSDTMTQNKNGCIPLSRSAPACNMVSPVREQINLATSYIDGSHIYGSDEQTAAKLRDYTSDRGLLATNQEYSDNGRPYLPSSGNALDLCGITNKSAGVPCFMAGDIRVNQEPGITALNTLFFREHNRIASELHQINPQWNGDTLYEETRKIIGSILQAITYQEWLPVTLGSEMSYILPSYTSYNDQEDPRVTTAYTVAFHMDLTMANQLVYKLDQEYQPIGPPVPLNQTYFATSRIVFEGGLDPILRGMMVNPTNLNQQDIADELGTPFSHDLIANMIQRGRDHGLPGYNAWRRFCGLPAPSNLSELATVLNNRDLAESLLDLYGTAENIDFSVGALAEPWVPGASIGKTMSCVLGNQFRRLREGDWFYFQNPLVFSPQQQASIAKMTMAGIICENTNITKVPLNVFMRNRYPEDFEDCSRIPKLDLLPWRVSL